MKSIGNKKTKISLLNIINNCEKIGLSINSNEYVNTSTPVTITDKNGYKYFMSYNSFKNNKTYLKKFYLKNKYTIFNIQHYIDLNGFNCKILSKTYNGSICKLKFLCECGNVFETTLEGFLGGKKRCGVCNKSTSNFEYSVSKLLEFNEVKFIREYSFDDCKNINKLRFDFAIFDNYDNLKCLIELDGMQHKKPQRFGGIKVEEAYNNYLKLHKNDLIKDEYCKQRDIKLYRIPYSLFRNNKYIEEINKIIAL